MIVLLRHFLGWLIGAFRPREDLILENLALRQQLLVVHSKRPRPRLGSLDRLFWVGLRKFWSGWRKSLILVTPETVVRWHRTGFRLYWAWLSRAPSTAGRKALSREVRELVFRMVIENPTWGAPRIHGELLKLGFDISERTVSRWVKRALRSPDPVRRWLTFLRNHREAIAAMDFFTVPTLTFGILYCFFVIDHDRRKILHFNVTRNPNSFWVALQLRQTGTKEYLYYRCSQDCRQSHWIPRDIVEETAWKRLAGVFYGDFSPERLFLVPFPEPVRGEPLAITNRTENEAELDFW